VREQDVRPLFRAPGRLADVVLVAVPDLGAIGDRLGIDDEDLPLETSAGVLYVDATATSTDLAQSGTALGGCTVAPGLAPMVVTLSPLGTYPKNSTVPIMANVTRTDSSVVAGSSVLFSVTAPGGAATTKIVIADGAGRAAWNYKVSPKAASGSYAVTARATFNGESVDAVPVNLTVPP
jgi:hypothetical protein